MISCYQFFLLSSISPFVSQFMFWHLLFSSYGMFNLSSVWGQADNVFLTLRVLFQNYQKPVQLDINRLIDISLLLYLGGSKPWGWCYCMNNLFDKIATVVVRVSALRKVFSKKLKVENDNSWLETIMIHNYQVQM